MARNTIQFYLLYQPTLVPTDVGTRYINENERRATSPILLHFPTRNPSYSSAGHRSAGHLPSPKKSHESVLSAPMRSCSAADRLYVLVHVQKATHLELSRREWGLELGGEVIVRGRRGDARLGREGLGEMCVGLRYVYRGTRASSPLPGDGVRPSRVDSTDSIICTVSTLPEGHVRTSWCAVPAFVER